MIVITGAAGFIGSCLTGKLNSLGMSDLVLVDDFHGVDKKNNFRKKSYTEKIDRNKFFTWAEKNKKQITYILHIGARTDTTETNWDILKKLNVDFSESVWNFCVKQNIPLIYASSAATYGNGKFGYADDHTLVETLQPLNLYGESKNNFDKFVLQQKETPPFWAALKFFNVYGPNEYHKGRMASVIYHAFMQIINSGKMKLFKSHNKQYADGEQKRDFIYVKDVIDIIAWMMKTKPMSGIYNVGTGMARTFYELADATAYAMQKDLQIEWIDIPEDIRDTYQYYTEAPMKKLRNAGYAKDFYSLEDGIEDYVQNYLMEQKFY